MKNLICTTLLVETSPQGLPLGAACIASSIKADSRTCSAYRVELMDFSLEDDELVAVRETDGDGGIARLLAQRLASKKADFVCFSVYVWNRVILEKTCLELKKIHSNCVCISGGPEVTANPLSFKSFDYMIAGQGERAMVELLSALNAPLLPPPGQNGWTFGIQGVYFRQEKSDETSTSASTGNSLESAVQSSENPCAELSSQVIRACPFPPDMTASPYLDGTLDPGRYGGALWELARGCPFKCSYCYESKGEKKIAYFPMERLEKEIELFASKKISQVFVLDPTYNASKERAIKMLKIIEKKAPGMFFYFEARAEFIDRELARAFSRIPCCLQIGLQSANPDVLKNVHRTLDKKLFVKNIGFLNEEGVTFGFDLIYGLPGDNFQGFKSSIDFALSLYPNNLELFCLSVLPGTKLHDDAQRFGMVWENEPPYHVMRTPQFNEENLAKAKKLAQATNLFYSQGRAVPWFNSVLYPLHEKASVFLWDFSEWLEKFGFGLIGLEKSNLKKDVCDYSADEIIKLQTEFVRKKYADRHLLKLFDVAQDLIAINGALGKCTFDGSQSVFTTHYHPDDVMSEYGSDLEFFAENAGKQKCRVKVFEGKNGADWQVL